jgi:hypothetical protein
MTRTVISRTPATQEPDSASARCSTPIADCDASSARRHRLQRSRRRTSRRTGRSRRSWPRSSSTSGRPTANCDSPSSSVSATIRTRATSCTNRRHSPGERQPIMDVSGPRRAAALPRRSNPNPPVGEKPRLGHRHLRALNCCRETQSGSRNDWGRWSATVERVCWTCRAVGSKSRIWTRSFFRRRNTPKAT